MESKNQTKQKIFQVAMKLFKEKSFQDVTINEICKESGVTKHTFYYYFSSKDELLKKFYTIPCEISANDLATILNAESYVEQLWLLNKNIITFLNSTDRDILKQIFVKNITSDVGTFSISEDHKQRMELQTGIIRKGQEAKQFLNTSDPQGLAVVFRQSIMSNTILYLMKGQEFHADEVIRFVFEIILNVAPEYRTMPNFHWTDLHKNQ